MENAIVKINPADYGLNETKAKEIEAMFKPMLDKMVELEKEFNKVANLEISADTCKKAYELRLRYVKVRTGTAAIHKELKAFYLNGGRFVDGWKNAQLFASQGMEEKLSAIENHFEIIKAERIRKLQEKRQNELMKYGVEYISGNLGDMPDNVWASFLLGTKTNYDNQKAAEKKAEEERIAREKAEAAERERIRKENEQLKKEAEERERLAKIEAEKRAKEEAARLKREESETKKRIRIETERLEREEVERKAREEKERKEWEAHESALRKEREAKEKVEAELKAKRETEAKAEAERLANIEAELNKGDAAKVRDLVQDLESLKSKYQFKSQKNRKMYDNVGILIDKVIDFIRK